MDIETPAENENTPPIEIPLEALSEDALAGVIQGFILREGTDYGTEEVSMQTKTDQIRRQLAQGKVRIVFDPSSQSVTLMTEREWLKLRQGQSPEIP